MRKSKWIAILLAAVMLAFPLSGCKPADRELTDAEKAALAAEIDKIVNSDDFSGAVYVVHRGEALYDGGAGEATRDEANKSAVAYGVASLTKQFTAACVLQLYDEGKLDINDKLEKYFPDYACGDRITLRQLMCMRSGIPDYSVESVGDRVIVTCDGDDGAGVEIFSENSADENIEIIRAYFLSRELLFTPGEGCDYSDSNFALLAAIVEQTSGERYHDYVRAHIFEPLGMDGASFIDDYDSSYADRVVIAESDRTEFNQNYYLFKGAEYGCGDILATPVDLYKWYRGLCGGEVISDRSYRLMTKNYSKKDEMGYGFGLRIRDGETKLLSHTGYIPSYYSTVYFLPEYDCFITALANHATGQPYEKASQVLGCFADTIGLEPGQ